MKLVKNIGLVGIMTIISMTTYANSNAAVNSQQCGTLVGTEKPFILALKKGEDLRDAVLTCANDAQLTGATLTGLGGIAPTTLLYFDHETKIYHRKTINEFMELVSLTGNITHLNGKRVDHMHVSLSGKDYTMTGGHLDKATVAAIAEIKITPLSGDLNKKHDDETGLDIIVTD